MILREELNHDSRKTIERLYGIANFLDDEAKARFSDYVKMGTDKLESIREIKAAEEVELASLVLAFEEDIRKDEAKKSGRNGALQAAKNILKAARKNPREEFHYARQDGDKQIIIDGVRLVILSEADRLPLEAMPKNIPITFNYKNCIPINLDDELVLPDLGDLKAKVKILKAKHKKAKSFMYDFGKGFPGVNAEYLIDLMEIFKGEKKVTYITSKGEFSCIAFQNANNSFGMLLPMKKTAMSGELTITAE